MIQLTEAQTDRVIQMAWEDRTTFDAIRKQFGLEPGQVIKLMRKHMKPSSFRMWRKRTDGRNTKHLSKRAFKVGRFRCKSQTGLGEHPMKVKRIRTKACSSCDEFKL